MIFRLEIDTAGMPDGGTTYAEVARILRATATRIGDGEVRPELNAVLLLRDVNGREVGSARFVRAEMSGMLRPVREVQRVPFVID